MEQGFSDAQIFLLYNHPASKGVACGEGFNEAQGLNWNSCAYQKRALAAFNR